MQDWKLTGDADVMILSASNAIAGSPSYPGELRNQTLQKKLIEFISSESDMWTARTLVPELGMTRGQAVFIDSMLNGAIIAADLAVDGNAIGKIRKQLIVLLQAISGTLEVPADAFKDLSISGANAILFENGELSIAFHVRIKNGWENGGLRQILGPRNRNAVTYEITKILTRLHEDFTKLLNNFLHKNAGKLSKVQDIAGSEIGFPEFDSRVDSLNVIYAGEHSGELSAALPDEYRHFVYPRGVADVVSQSPRRDEFVFLGYAFGIIAAPNPTARARELSLVPRLLHVAFNNLTSTSTEVRALLHSKRPKRLEMIRTYYRRLQAEIQAVQSPTMMFRHEMLILRDEIMKEWFVDRSIDEAQTLLHALYEDEGTRAEKRQQRRDRVLNFVLALLAVVSTVGVISDLRDLGWWPFN